MSHTNESNLTYTHTTGLPRGMQLADSERHSNVCIEAGARHQTAGGRGTIINVFDAGNSCQVRWDATGLVRMYDTGRNDDFTLQVRTYTRTRTCVGV